MAQIRIEDQLRGETIPAGSSTTSVPSAESAMPAPSFEGAPPRRVVTAAAVGPSQAQLDDIAASRNSREDAAAALADQRAASQQDLSGAYSGQEAIDQRQQQLADRRAARGQAAADEQAAHGQNTISSREMQQDTQAEAGRQAAAAELQTTSAAEDPNSPEAFTAARLAQERVEVTASVANELKQKYARGGLAGGQVDPAAYEAAAEEITNRIYDEAPDYVLTRRSVIEHLNQAADQYNAQLSRNKAKVTAELATQGAITLVDSSGKTYMEHNPTPEQIEFAAKRFARMEYDNKKAEQEFYKLLGESAPGVVAGKIMEGADTVYRAFIESPIALGAIALEKVAELAGGGRGAEEQAVTTAVTGETASDEETLAKWMKNSILYYFAASEAKRMSVGKAAAEGTIPSVEMGPVRLSIVDALEMSLPITGVVGTLKKFRTVQEASAVLKAGRLAELTPEQILERIGAENRWLNPEKDTGGVLIQRNSVLNQTIEARAEQVAADQGRVTEAQGRFVAQQESDIAAREADIAAAKSAGRAPVPGEAIGQPKTVAEHRTQQGSLFGQFLAGQAGEGSIEHATGVKYIKAAADAVRKTIGSHQAVDIASHIDDLQIANDPMAEEAVWTAAKEGAKWGKRVYSAEEAGAIKSLPTRPGFVDRALAAWNDLTPGVKNVGKGWYEIARHDIEDIAGSAGLRSQQVAAVFAALSPEQAWGVNSRTALVAIGAWIKDSSRPLPMNLSKNPENIRKAEAILAGVDPEVVLNQGVARGTGRKVYNFYNNLNGNMDAVTVDRHIAAFFDIPHVGAGSVSYATKKGGSPYDDIVNAIKQAALEAGVNPEQMQAALWHYVRPAEGMTGQDALRYRAPSIKSIEKAATEIVDLHVMNEGATFNLESGRVTKGYAVSVHPEREVIVQGHPSVEDVKKFIRDNADILSGDESVGTWFHDGQTYLDVTTTKSSLSEAMALAVQHDQQAIFDLEKGMDIPVEEAKPYFGAMMSRSEPVTKVPASRPSVLGARLAGDVDLVASKKLFYDPTQEEGIALLSNLTDKEDLLLARYTGQLVGESGPDLQKLGDALVKNKSYQTELQQRVQDLLPPYVTVYRGGETTGMNRFFNGSLSKSIGTDFAKRYNPKNAKFEVGNLIPLSIPREAIIGLGSRGEAEVIIDRTILNKAVKQTDLAAAEESNNLRAFFGGAEGGSAKVGFALGVDQIKMILAEIKKRNVVITPEEEALLERIGHKTATGEVLTPLEKALSARVRKYLPRAGGLVAPAFLGQTAGEVVNELKQIPGWDKKKGNLIAAMGHAVRTGTGLEGVPQDVIDKFTLANAQIAAKNFGQSIPRTLDEAKQQFPAIVYQMETNSGVAANAQIQQVVQTLKAGLDPELVKATMWDTFLSIYNLPRSIRAAYDLSAPLRQGVIFAVAHPFKTGGATKDMVHALFSEKFADRLMQEITTNKFAKSGVPGAELTAFGYEKGSVYDKMKLYFAPIHDAPLEVREEALISKYVTGGWFASHTGLKQSNRAYNVFLNKMRSDVADAALEAGIRSGKPFTQPEMDALGAFINHATGRGGIPNEYAPALTLAMFSPRFFVSRVQAVGDALAFFKQPGNRGSQLAAKDMAKFMAGEAALIGLNAAGHQIWPDIFGEPEIDPRAGDFGKLKIGPHTIDLGGSFTQLFRFAAQLSKGEAKSADGEILDAARGDTILRFARSKASPGAGIAWTWASGHTHDAELRPGGKVYEYLQEHPDLIDTPLGINYNGDVVAVKDLLGIDGESLWFPMSWVDMKQAIEAEFAQANPDALSIARGVGVGALSAIGAGTMSDKEGRFTPGAPTTQKKNTKTYK